MSVRTAGLPVVVAVTSVLSAGTKTALTESGVRDRSAKVRSRSRLSNIFTSYVALSGRAAHVAIRFPQQDERPTRVAFLLWLIVAHRIRASGEPGGL